MIPSCDQIGVPIHFHSSTTSGSAALMSLRILPRVSPRQSPSSAIRFEMSSDADVFLDIATSRVDTELLGVFRVQPPPAAEPHRVTGNDAADRSSAEKPIQHIETNVPPGGAHRDEAAIDVGPQGQARAGANGFEFPPHIEAAPLVFQHLGSVGSRHR